MPVAIRLSRIGTKHKPFFRIVVVDSRKKRDGAVLENIGTYDALKSSLITFDADLYDAWVKNGAQPSDSAKRLYRLYKKAAQPAASQPASSAPVKKDVESKKAKQSDEAAAKPAS